MTELISAEQRGSISFRPHARLIRLLGDELISDEIMATVELVKNGYDADATTVSISLDHATDPDAGCITIRDDGDGMDLFTVLHIWMEPATSHKRERHRAKQRTARGRILLGEKGVGRFAADKLGAQLELVTRNRSSTGEIVLQVFWHHFDQDGRYLDDVENVWYVREPVAFSGDRHGTLLTIRSLRSGWTQETVGKLYNGLARLLSPFNEKDDFVIEIDSPEFPAVQGKIVNHLLDTAPYRLSGFVDDEGQFLSDNKQGQPVDLRVLCHSHFLSTEGAERVPECGQFRISLNVWDLDIKSGKRVGIDRALRDAIKSFSGVSIYRDSFRIWPYGEKDDDWLELNQRRVNNPTLRVSNNQIIGYIEITHENNPDLKDRTSREGLIDTQAFFDLKALVLAALSLLEGERFNLRHRVTLSRVTVVEENDRLLSYLSRIGDLAGSTSVERGLRNAVREIEQIYYQSLEQERKRYDRISALAGVGMAAELLTDGLTREINKTVLLLRTLQGEAQMEANPRIRQLVEVLLKHMNLIHEQLDLVEPLYHPLNQVNEPVDVRGALYDILSAMRYRLNESKVQVKVEDSPNLIVRTGRGYLMQAMMIIIANALEAMAEASIPVPHLAIQIVAESACYGILIANNGPPIPESYRKQIFEPAFSIRQTGRGLGLHVACDLLAACNCSLDLDQEVSLLDGPCFRIHFDGRRVIN